MGIPSAELGDHFRRLEDSFPPVLHHSKLSTILGFHFSAFLNRLCESTKAVDLKALLKLESAKSTFKRG